MYGNAYGASSGSAALTYGLEIEAVYSSSIRKISLSGLDDRMINKSRTSEGITITGHSVFEDAIDISGTATANTFFFIGQTKNVYCPEGMYIIDSNFSGTASGKPTLEFSNGPTGLNSGGNYWSFNYLTDRSYSFPLHFATYQGVTNSDLIFWLYFKKGDYFASGSKLRIRLFWIGANPSNYMVRKNAIFVQTSATASSSYVLLSRKDIGTIVDGTGIVIGCDPYDTVSYPKVNIGKGFDLEVGIAGVKFYRNRSLEEHPSFIIKGTGWYGHRAIQTIV